jgi:hypothetical protein
MDGMALCLDDVTETIVKQPSKIYIHLKIKLPCIEKHSHPARSKQGFQGMSFAYCHQLLAHIP